MRTPPWQCRRLLVTALVLLYLASYTCVVLHDWPNFVKKELFGHDEHVNSAVSANLTRQFFPAKVRVNPLIEDFNGDWMEGPHWQHIPPLFAYVPLPLYWADGRVSIEMTRVAFSLMTAATGSIFIIIVYLATTSISSALAATIASVLWTVTPFTRQLAVGQAFGTSDIVLAFTVTVAFGAIVLYLGNARDVRQHYSLTRTCLVAATVSLPILTKNVLGAIPAATFFGIVAWDCDSRRTWIRAIAPTLAFLAILLVYYGVLFVSSPKTFCVEMVAPFRHFENYEGWGRPWHTHITQYLPEHYLRAGWPLFVSGLIIGVWCLVADVGRRRDRLLLFVSGGWFVGNVVAVTLVTSKCPNFVYQAYLLGVFFVVYPPVLLVGEGMMRLRWFTLLKKLPQEWPRTATVLSLAVCLTAATAAAVGFTAIRRELVVSRSSPYYYSSKREQFYELGEYAQSHGVGTQDLFIIHPFADDYWLRYYLIFLTGAESRRRDEVLQHAETMEDVKRKYRRVLLVCDRASSHSDTITERFPVVQATPAFQITTVPTDSLDSNLTVADLLGVE